MKKKKRRWVVVLVPSPHARYNGLMADRRLRGKKWGRSRDEKGRTMLDVVQASSNASDQESPRRRRQSPNRTTLRRGEYKVLY